MIWQGCLEERSEMLGTEGKDYYQPLYLLKHQETTSLDDP